MKILFLCSSNIFRSQMAEAFFKKFNKNLKHSAKSAALIQPQEKMHALVVRAMAEKGINISKNSSDKVTKEMLNEADLIILMNPKLELLARELAPYKKIKSWNIEDVVATETDEHLYPEFVKARDIIEKDVKELLQKIH